MAESCLRLALVSARAAAADKGVYKSFDDHGKGRCMFICLSVFVGRRRDMFRAQRQGNSHYFVAMTSWGHFALRVCHWDRFRLTSYFGEDKR